MRGLSAKRPSRFSGGRLQARQTRESEGCHAADGKRAELELEEPARPASPVFGGDARAGARSDRRGGGRGDRGRDGARYRDLAR